MEKVLILPFLDDLIFERIRKSDTVRKWMLDRDIKVIGGYGKMLTFNGLRIPVKISGLGVKQDVSVKGVKYSTVLRMLYRGNFDADLGERMSLQEFVGRGGVNHGLFSSTERYSYGDSVTVNELWEKFSYYHELLELITGDVIKPDPSSVVEDLPFSEDVRLIARAAMCQTRYLRELESQHYGGLINCGNDEEKVFNQNTLSEVVDGNLSVGYVSITGTTGIKVTHGQTKIKNTVLHVRDLSIISSFERLKLKIDTYISEGVVKPRKVILKKYDESFADAITIYVGRNEDHPSIVEGKAIYYGEDKKGVKRSILDNWDIESIPDKVSVRCVVDGIEKEEREEIDLRRILVRRVMQEANEFGYKMLDIAALFYDPIDPVWRRYTDYVFSTDMSYEAELRSGETRLKLGDSGPLLKHKMLHVATNSWFQRSIHRWTDKQVQMSNEIALLMLDDPLRVTGKLRTHMALPLNVTFSDCDDEMVLNWGKFSLDRGAHLRGGTWMKRREKSVFVIDMDAFESDIGELEKMGCQKISKALDELRTARVSREDVRTNAMMRTSLAFCGFTGSDVVTAAIDQFETYKDMDEPDDEFIRKLEEHTFSMAAMGGDLIGHDNSKLTDRYSAMLRSRKPNSASIDKPKTFKLRVPVVRSEIDKGVFRRYNKIDSVEVKFNDKTGAMLMLTPEDMKPYDTWRTAARPAGSRLVPGGRPTRLVFPMPLATYLGEVLSLSHILDIMSRGGIGDNRIPWNAPGGGKEFGVPAMTLSHLIQASGQVENGLLIVAADYSAFDSSQRDKIRRAKARGILRALKRKFGWQTNCDKTTFIFWGLPNIYDMLYDPEANIKREYSLNARKLVLETDGLPSGTLTTYTENTLVNDELSYQADDLIRTREPEIAEEMNPMVVFKHHMGDDTADIYKVDNVDRNSAEYVLDSYIESAKLGAVKISKKRCISSTSRTEHIKVGITHGVIIPNNQLQIITAEKHNNKSSSVTERMSSMYDGLMVSALRSADPELSVNVMVKLWPVVGRMDCGDCRWYVTPGILFASNLIGALPTASVIRGGTSLLLCNGLMANFLGHMNGLVDLMNGDFGWSREAAGMNSELILKSMKNSIWHGAFKRERTRLIDMRRFGASSEKKEINDLRPENGLSVLVTEILSSKLMKEGNLTKTIRILSSLLDRGIKFSLPEYSLLKMRLFNAENSALAESPYISSGGRILDMQRVLGLTTGNQRDRDGTARIDAVLKRYSGCYAPHVNGRLIMAAALSIERENLDLIPISADMSEELGTEIVQILEKVVDSFEFDQLKASESVYDSVMASVDLSEFSMAPRVKPIFKDPVISAMQKNNLYREVVRRAYNGKSGIISSLDSELEVY